MEKKRFFECSNKYMRKFKVGVQCRKSNSLKEDAIQSDQIICGLTISNIKGSYIRHQANKSWRKRSDFANLQILL